MLVKGIHHVSLTCTTKEQYEKTISFYNNVLEIDVWKQWTNGIMFRTGLEVIEVFLKEELSDLPQGAIRHFAFAVDSVDACIEKVRQEGYTITVEPKDVAIPAAPAYLARVGFCIGPVGEEIEFFQER